MNWPTPMQADGEKHSPAVRMASGNHTLTSADLQAWPTPMAHDAAPGNPARVGRFGTKHGGPTPTASASTGAGSANRDGGPNIQTAVAAWATPASRDFRHPNKPDGASRLKRAEDAPNSGDQLPNQVGGALNPAWVEILMGWPIGWTDAGNPCPGIWPGWPMGMGPEQHSYEPHRVAPKGTVPGRVARVKACGNGVVPQQADLAFTLLMAPAVPFLES